jgi:mevalonate kinase
VQQFYSHGKLLISGEYLILRGALALAIACRYGQHMQVEESDKDENILHWISIDDKGNTWFETQLSKTNFHPLKKVENTSNETLLTLTKLLSTCRKFNSSFLSGPQNLLITNTLEFPLDWGLGSSSTLINNIAKLAKVDAFKLNSEISNGSGYDIACADAGAPILFKLEKDEAVWDTVRFTPPQPDQINFIQLGNKQNTASEIEKFKRDKSGYEREIFYISELTEALLFCDDLDDFITLIDEHEEVMQYVLQQEKIKTRLFNDFDGAIKSLGAWGGDFIMTVSKRDGEYVKNYFKEKNYSTILQYNEMAYFGN